MSRVSCYTQAMLTRGQVAKRLGKSIATIRRMEGRELHPERDPNGIMRFDPEEVERAQGPRRGRRLRGYGEVPTRRSRWFEAQVAPRDGDGNQAEAKEEEDRLARERARKTAVLAAREEFARLQLQEDARKRIEQERAEQAVRDAARKERAALQAELIETLETCSPRELRALFSDPEFLETVEAIARDE
jgi:hypothetical protein